MNEDRLIVLCTVPDGETAAAIAARLVKDSLAACVNILPAVTSVYVWDGEVQNDAEQLLVIKTRSGVFQALEKAVLELHPYELPEIIAVPIQYGLSGYLTWIDQTTGS
ncbi:MAG TPA: divalent-cation tolerance protein CutA [Gammaproteobacteria bacterium]|nr:divalent-cation tolerance protein CutA [Gammaproteobacteria bacterium]